MFTRILFALTLLLTALTPARAQTDRVEPQIIVPQRRIIMPPEQSPVQVVGVDVHIDLRDRIAVTELAVTLHNPARRQAEARLLIPVPDGSAIRSFGLDGLGDEPTGRLLPRAQARKIYNEIVRKMIDPGLLEFVGTAVIQSSVFPVPAGGEQTFRVTYEQLLPIHRGRVDYFLPRTESLDATGVEWTITADVRTKHTLGPIFSASHDITTEADTPGRAHIKVNNAGEPGAFRLSYMIQDTADAPMTCLFYPDPRVGSGNGGYFMLVAGADTAGAPDRVAKREITLVIDRSGSMANGKLEQAVAAAKQIIGGLKPGERFNIIDYSDTVERFSPVPVEKTSESAEQALVYLSRLSARGSTNLHDALVEALRQPTNEAFLPMVLFLTDGLPTAGITGEVAIRESAAKANKSDRRVFTFGVGFDVNAPLLTGIATTTRGTPTFILPDEDVEVKVGQVWDKLDGPVLVGPQIRSIAAEFRGKVGVHPSTLIRETQPNRLPDLFKGDQLVVVGQYMHTDDFKFTLQGKVPGGSDRSWTINADPSTATTANSFIPRLWAQRKIASLIEQVRQAGADGQQPDAEITDEIVRLSLEHGIMTEYTAFLAAEETEFARQADDTSAGTPVQLRRENRDRMTTRNSARSGRGGVSQSKNVQKMVLHSKAAPASNAYMDAEMKQVTITTVQRVNDQTLYNRRGRWIDARLAEHEDKDPDQTIAFGSDEYWKLLDDLVTQNRQGLLANRGEIYLLNRGQRILVRNPS